MIGNNATTAYTSAGELSTSSRIPLIHQALRAAMDAAYGTQELSEHELNQLLGELVKSKLLSAEQSYELRDRLFDREAFGRYIEKRTNDIVQGSRMGEQTIASA